VQMLQHMLYGKAASSSIATLTSMCDKVPQSHHSTLWHATDFACFAIPWSYGLR